MASKIKPTTAKKPVAGKVAKDAKATARKEKSVPSRVTKAAKHAKPTPKVAKEVKPAAKVVKHAKPVANAPVVSKAKPVVRKSHVDSKSLARIQEMLIKMRDRLTGQITALSDDTLKYVDDSSSEDRTDDFDREFALNLVSTEQDSVFEIDNALRRIKDGAYGSCDYCGCAIEKARLQALPFARMCVKCQSAQEKGRVRFRPFGEALELGVEQETPEVVEPEENE
jgi:DnaK suppressor protein